MKLVARGLVPDGVVRWKIRSLLRERLTEESAGGESAIADRRRRLVALLDASPVALATAEANAQHYEVPPRFFELVLGPRLKYSCALFEDTTTTLAAAEDAMLELSVKRADLADGQRILDLGCGWGSLSLFLAHRLPAARILGVSNSRDQRTFIETRARERGLTNLEIRTADMNVFDPGDRFDRIVSIEMLEHMRNYREVLRRIASWLAPDGRLFVHVFAHRTLAYPFEVRNAGDWMARHFFTGGMMPSHDLLPSFQNDLACTRSWWVDGLHYARTAEEWLRSLDRNRPEILALFARDLGPSAARLRLAMWRVFFMSCAELWGFAGGTEWGVSHALFAPVRAR
ncbi:MAG: class I SAM-dependent methyltransferase [Candidatus Brocadiae bacterium]|nr:class I SAM-dependent methyltransferase [Candidatus Brocadiia bacterium]